jgi:hypothetical protein
VYEDRETITQVLALISNELASVAKNAFKDVQEGRIPQYNKRETYKKWAAEAKAKISQVIGLEPQEAMGDGEEVKGNFPSELKTTIINMIS